MLSPPPATTYCIISFPRPDILLVTLNRPKSLNCINVAGHVELHDIWEWFDAEPSLKVAIFTGKGRAFCAGADLKGMYHIYIYIYLISITITIFIFVIRKQSD